MNTLWGGGSTLWVHIASLRERLAQAKGRQKTRGCFCVDVCI